MSVTTKQMTLSFCSLISYTPEKSQQLTDKLNFAKCIEFKLVTLGNLSNIRFEQDRFE